MKAKLHHFAYTIKPNSLEVVLELFEKLECTLSYREENARWCIIEQKPIPVRIQLIETTDQSVQLEKKTNSHIAFLSDNPKEDIEKIRQWLQEKNINCIQGSWSDKQLWFDLPDVFTNFVIEIMHTSVDE